MVFEAFTNFSIDRTKWGLMYGDESKLLTKRKISSFTNKVGVGFNINAKAEKYVIQYFEELKGKVANVF